MLSKSPTFFSIALSFVIAGTPSSDAFSSSNIKTRSTSYYHSSSTELKYRSLHHGPDVEPPSDHEKLGPDSTKMSKDKIDRFGPGGFEQFADFPDQFDGGDSEMGLSGDGNVGLKNLGREESPHLARTFTAKIHSEESYQQGVASMSYEDELLQANPGMDQVRARQLENWATQQEIALANRYMNERSQESYGSDEGYFYEDTEDLSTPVEAGDDLEGTITLKAPINRVARHDIMLKNPFMGFAKSRAAFVGDACSEWSVTPSDGFLKQNEATHFAVCFKPHSPGISMGHLVIETEDFKKTWKVVGSTGEYEF